jgi:hypothetical protein
MPAVKDLDDNAIFCLKSGKVEKFLSASRLSKFKAPNLENFLTVFRKGQCIMSIPNQIRPICSLIANFHIVPEVVCNFG